MKTASELENIIIVKELKIQQQNLEIERLKQGYCELKEKCNKGECDCTNEEYNNMCEQNIKLDLEIERLNNIIKEVREYINWRLEENQDIYITQMRELLEILDKVGSDKK